MDPAVLQASAVSLKLPKFWTDAPEVWFIQAEAEFGTRQITQDATKYNYLVAALDKDTAMGVLSTLRTVPQANKYAALKTRLLATYGLNKFERAARLLEPQALGEEAPSALMEKMLNIRGDLTLESIFQWLFLRQLPEDIRAILIAAKHADSQALAGAADELWKQRRAASTGHVQVVEQVQQEDVSAIRGKRPPGGEAAKAADKSICRSHRKWGEKAFTCQPPCLFQGLVKERTDKSKQASNQGNGPAGRP